MNEIKKYACKNCGHPYEAYPPDDVHVVSNTGICATCYHGHFGYYTQANYECENCSHGNILYWHVARDHSLGELAMARMNKQRSFENALTDKK